MNKKGFQLSLNMIISVILAFVFLGVAIAFIINWMPGDPPEIPTKCDIYPPTKDKPLCINSDIKMERGKTIKLKTAFFNDEDATIESTILPTIICGNNLEGDTLTLDISTTGKTISVGDYEDYSILLRAPSNAVKGSYPCTFKVSNSEASLFIEIQ